MAARPIEAIRLVLATAGLAVLAGCASADHQVLPNDATSTNAAAHNNTTGSTAATSMATPAGTSSATAVPATTAPRRSSGPPIEPTSPTPSPTITTHASTLKVTESDSGRTFLVDIGSRVHLELSPNGGNYDQPHTDSARVLHEDNHSGGYPGTSTAVADFTVIGPGTAQITSQTDYACLHTTPPCLPPRREFILTVTAL